MRSLPFARSVGAESEREVEVMSVKKSYTDDDAAFEFVKKVVEEESAKNRIVGLDFHGDAFFSHPTLTHKLSVPLHNGESRARKFCNDIFHRLGLLPKDDNLEIGDMSRFCLIERQRDCYHAVFNDPRAAVTKDPNPPGIGEGPLTIIQNYWERGELREFLPLDSYSIDDKDTMKETLADIKEGRVKAKSPEDVCILSAESFDKFARGEDTVLMYDFILHDIECVIGVKTILLKDGYGEPGCPPRQMRYAVAAVMLAEEDGKECDPYNVPKGFWPTQIAVHLGRRIDVEGGLKQLAFVAWDSPDGRPLLGCVGSLGSLRKLVCDGSGVNQNHARFHLYAESGEYGLETITVDPDFQAMRFLSVWRFGESSGEYRALCFDLRIVASIEKAGLSFINHASIPKYKDGDEIKLLDFQSAIEYIQSEQGSFADLCPTTASSILERFIWCAPDWRALCERRSDFRKAAEFDYGLLCMLTSSHNLEQQFLSARYCAYAMARNGVMQKWEDWPSLSGEGEPLSSAAIIAAIDIRAALRHEMKRLFYTPTSLAAGLGVSRKIVKCWFNGKGTLSREQYYALCRHLGVERLEGVRG